MSFDYYAFWTKPFVALATKVFESRFARFASKSVAFGSAGVLFGGAVHRHDWCDALAITIP